MNRYKVCQCPYCGKLSTIESNITFKCSYCGKSRVLKKKRELAMGVKIIKTFEKPLDASKYCAIAKDAYENDGQLINAGFYGGVK